MSGNEKVDAKRGQYDIQNKRANGCKGTMRLK